MKLKTFLILTIAVGNIHGTQLCNKRKPILAVKQGYCLLLGADMIIKANNKREITAFCIPKNAQFKTNPPIIFSSDNARFALKAKNFWLIYDQSNVDPIKTVSLEKDGSLLDFLNEKKAEKEVVKLRGFRWTEKGYVWFEQN